MAFIRHWTKFDEFTGKFAQPSRARITRHDWIRGVWGRMADARRNRAACPPLHTFASTIKNIKNIKLRGFVAFFVKNDVRGFVAFFEVFFIDF